MRSADGEKGVMTETVFTIRNILHGVELDVGESVTVRLGDGRERRIKILHAEVAGVHRGPLPYAPDREGAVSYRFACRLEVNGQEEHLTRTVPSQENFRDPPTVDGVHIWLDATGEVADLLGQHGPGNRCLPTKAVRLALWEAGGRICASLLHPWCPLPPGLLRVEDCYRGEDVWMGPYDGCECHGGLAGHQPSRRHAALDPAGHA